MRRTLIIIGVTFLVIAAIVYGIVLAAGGWKKATATTINQVLSETYEKRMAELPKSGPMPTSTDFEFPNKDRINILLLGLDSRKATTTSRCDAIHFFSLDTKEWKVKITSVPRGTRVPIPGETVSSTQYMANACGIAGHEYAIGEIEKLVGQKADYVVKVGFSQTLGLLRIFKLPTTESLQWLRNRKSFGIGDPQRSHNQAVFMKDVAISKLGLFRSTAALPLAKVAHSFVDSDLDFSSFYALLKGFADAEIDKHPENIELTMKPVFKTADYHFNFSNPAIFLEAFPRIGATSTTSAETTSTLATVQNDVTSYIRWRIGKPYSIQDVADKQLWRQIENEWVREDLHFTVLNKQLGELSAAQEKKSLIEAYVFEKETLGLAAWAEKGKKLLEEIDG